MAKIVLTTQQQAVIDDRGGTLLVSAAAGSGKTKVLIDRVLKRVEEGCHVDEFLLITFTQAAASELRGKMIAQLSERLAHQPNNRHLQQQMNRVYLAQISTVHAFCSVLLREYAHVLDLPGDFRVLNENEATMLRQKAMEEMLEQTYVQLREDAEILMALDMFGAGRSDKELPTLIDKIYDSIQCWRDPEQRGKDLQDAVKVKNCTDLTQTLWGKYLFDEMKTALEEYTSSISGAMETILKNESLMPNMANFTDDLTLVQRLSSAKSWNELSGIDLKFTKWVSVKNCPVPELQARLKQLRDGIRDDLRSRMKKFSLPTQQILTDLEVTSGAICGLLKLVERFSQMYRTMKLRRRVLDYNDLEHEALRLLVDRSGKPTPAAKEIAARFTEIMVDEYQDTNAVQDAIFNALAYRGNLFMVGDVKQSIYRFRMADPAGFLKRYQTYADYTEAKNGQPRKILLSDNFRSCPEVLSAANDVFRLLMSERVGGLRYGDAEALRANQPPHGDSPIELHCINMKTVPTENHCSNDEVEAEFVACRIEQMLRNGETITLGDTTRPIEPEDITILMRGLRGRTAIYISALKRHGISCVCGNENVLETQELCTLTALLKILDNPHQDIPLLCVLFSPLFCFSADNLAEVRAEHRDGDLFDALAASERGKDFVNTIAELREIAARASLHDLLNEIDERLCLRAIYPNCDYSFNTMLRIANTYESGERYGLSGFLHYLELQRERGLNVEQTPQKGAVRIMTMHKSKGLEFPVVFLAGLNKKFNDKDLNQDVLVDAELGIGAKRFDPEQTFVYPTIAQRAIVGRMKKESRSEELRVLYVAMTRPKCRLIMTCCGKTIISKLKNIAAKMTNPPLESYVSSVNALGDWVLMAAMTRTEAGELFMNSGYPAMSSVSEYPWRITFQDGADYLPDGNDSSEMPTMQSCTSVPELHKINYQHPASTLSAGKLTATQLKGRGLDEELLQEASHAPTLRFVRPNFEQAHGLSSTERGTAIHLAMQFLRYESCTQESSLHQELARLVDLKQLSQRQADAVPMDKILILFRSELGKRLLTAPKVVREFKFSVLEDGEMHSQALRGEKILLQGVADCCLIEEDGLTILDFKSDRILPGEEESRAAYYRGQLEAYSRALSLIFEMPVKERILYFFATDTAWMV